MQDYFKNTVVKAQINIVGKGGGCRQNASKEAEKISDSKKKGVIGG